MYQDLKKKINIINKILIILLLNTAVFGCKNNKIGNLTPTPVRSVKPQIIDLSITDQRIRLLGRSSLNDNELILSWTASGIEFNIDGTDASVEMYGLPYSESTEPYMAVYIDGKRDKTIKVTVPKSYIICENLNPGNHTIRIVKLSEGMSSRVLISKLTITGSILDKPKESTRRIEFVGDSITCGYGNIGKGDRFETSTEDGMQTWAALCAAELNADFNVIAASGLGLVRGQNNELFVRNMYDLTGYPPYGDKWDYKKFTPDIVVINLGTNDFAVGVKVDELKKGVKDFIAYVRGKYPDAEIVWAYGLMISQYSDELKEAVLKVQQKDSKVDYIQIPLQTGEWGVNAHPSAASHEIAADELTVKLKAIMGW